MYSVTTVHVTERGPAYRSLGDDGTFSGPCFKAWELGNGAAGGGEFVVFETEASKDGPNIGN